VIGRATFGIARPLARQQHRADDGDDEQHRGELEGEDVVAVQVDGELVDVGVVVTGVARGRDAVTRVDDERVTGADDRGSRRGRRGRSPSPRRAAAGTGIGSIDRSIAWSTPSSMSTNRNSTTMAPA
jgi:hypothetical protein